MATDQRTIAKHLNLSTATVCRSLKNDPGIHPDTRARVTLMAKQLGYQPRVGNRMDASQGAKNELTHIGVLTASSSAPSSQHHVVNNRILFGMSDAARSLRASLHVAYVPETDGEDGKSTVADVVNRTPMISDKAVAGMALLGTFPRDVVQNLSKQFPCVRVVHHEPGVPTDCVNHDDMGAVSQLVRHLLDEGHRRIGFATCDSIRERSYVQARFGGYVSALSTVGIPYDPAMCLGIDSPITIAEAADRMKPLIADGVSAWVCVHDGMGYEILRRLTESGLSVPNDVALCGFDDFDPPAGLPKLTTMNAPFESMGMAVVQRLMHLMKHPAADPVQIMFSARLVEGQTTRRMPQIA